METHSSVPFNLPKLLNLEDRFSKGALLYTLQLTFYFMSMSKE